MPLLPFRSAAQTERLLWCKQVDGGTAFHIHHVPNGPTTPAARQRRYGPHDHHSTVDGLSVTVGGLAPTPGVIRADLRTNDAAEGAAGLPSLSCAGFTVVVGTVLAALLTLVSPAMAGPGYPNVPGVCSDDNPALPDW